MTKLAEIGKIAATVGGAAWTVKSLVIIALDGNFQPFEGILYFIGVGGLLVGALGLGAFVAARWTGAARWVGFVAVVAVAVIVTSVASSVVQTSVADAYSGGNVGIEEEMGILTPGVIWLAIGLYLFAAARRQESDP